MYDYNQAFEKYFFELENALPSIATKFLGEKSDVSKAAMYSLLSGGKRIRGVLTLAVCDILTGEYKSAINFACAVEMLHCYSLIHDDLPCMDNDDFRRGKPSCHKAFGEDTALLAGDALLTAAFECIANSSLSADKALKAVQKLSFAAGANGMIYGQELDLFFETKKATSSQLEQVHKHKTGCLINAAVQLGAIAAGASFETVQKLSDYAFSVGLAFQIVDDILDVTSSAEVLGKPVGSDSENEKNTFVTLFGIEKSSQMVAELTDKACKIIGNIENNEFLIYLAQNLSSRKN